MNTLEQCRYLESRLTDSFLHMNPKELLNLDPHTRKFVCEQIQWAKGYSNLIELIEEQETYTRHENPLKGGRPENYLSKYFFSEKVISLLCSPKNLSHEWQKQKTLQAVVGWNNEHSLLCFELNKSHLINSNNKKNAYLGSIFLTNLRHDVSSFWSMRAKLCHILDYKNESLNSAYTAAASKPWSFEGFREIFYLLIEGKKFTQAKKVLEICHTIANIYLKEEDDIFIEELHRANSLLKDLAA